MTIILNPTKITGSEIHAHISGVIKDRKALGYAASLSSFCRDAGISKQQVNQYKRGAKPSPDGIYKIATGFKKWGLAVKIEV